jgi:fructose-1,6-bisphosphatase/inositol monophosphatase family enzyme
VQTAVAGVWGSEEARALQGRGAGGDRTVYIDSVAEDAVLRVLDDVHRGGRNFQLISEEVGERDYGVGGDVIVVDPIDGSHNAKMGIPFFSLTLAAARDRTLGAVYEASVRNLATGDTYRAAAGGGATLGGMSCRLAPGSDADINVLQVEPTRIDQHLHRYLGLMERAQKVRMLGSAALNICLVASGALSLSVAPTLRSVDCAAPLLVLREASGVAADFDGNSIDGVDMGLATRSSVIAARNQPTLDLALELIHAESSAPGGA